MRILKTQNLYRAFIDNSDIVDIRKCSALIKYNENGNMCSTIIHVFQSVFSLISFLFGLGVLL